MPPLVDVSNKAKMIRETRGRGISNFEYLAM